MTKPSESAQAALFSPEEISETSLVEQDFATLNCHSGESHPNPIDTSIALETRQDFDSEVVFPAASRERDSKDLENKRFREDFDISLLGLTFVKGLGRGGIKALYDYFSGDLESVWGKSLEELSHVLAKARVPRSEEIAEQIVDERAFLRDKGYEAHLRLAQKNVSIIRHFDLPKRLAEIPDYPRWLFVQGKESALHNHSMVAVVGTREPSIMGKKATAALVRVMAPYDITVVSGLASGIDEEAHRTSLSEGKTNVAFLGHGINVIFPSSTARIRETIVEQDGAVATEYLPDEHYTKSYFVQRNRLQAAISDLVIPVEASIKGGTVHTIKFALKYGREVIGVRWNGESEILSFLSGEGCQIFNPNTTEGRKKLDWKFQLLVRQSQFDVNPLQHIVRVFRRELEFRNVTETDVNRLLQVLKNVASKEFDNHA